MPRITIFVTQEEFNYLKKIGRRLRNVDAPVLAERIVKDYVKREMERERQRIFQQDHDKRHKPVT